MSAVTNEFFGGVRLSSPLVHTPWYLAFLCEKVSPCFLSAGWIAYLWWEGNHLRAPRLSDQNSALYTAGAYQLSLDMEAVSPH